MTRTQQAIRLAVEKGGYRCRITNPILRVIWCDQHNDICYFATNGTDPRHTRVDRWDWTNNEAFLDPLFWRALAKARGWIDIDYPDGKMRCTSPKCDSRYCEYAGYKNPKTQAMYFFEHIMDGKDAESFFTAL